MKEPSVFYIYHLFESTVCTTYLYEYYEDVCSVKSRQRIKVSFPSFLVGVTLQYLLI